MTGSVSAILPASSEPPTHPPTHPPTPTRGGGGGGEEEASLTTALNATFRFALPEECLPSRGLEAVEWLAKGPPRVRPTHRPTHLPNP